MDKLFGQQDPARLRDSNGGCSKMAMEEAAELALANLKAISKRGHISVIIERAGLDHL
jgi:hypothetical protein